MKVLLYISILSGGGAERVMCQLANGLSENHEVILVAAYQTDNEYSVSTKVEKIYIDDSVDNKHSFRQIARLRKLINQRHPDVCLSFMPAPNYKLLLAAIGTNTKTIISVRWDPVREYSSGINSILYKMLYPLADGVVFQTKRAQSWFEERIRRKSRVIMNPVALAFFEKKRVSGDYWVATGRLAEEKNYSLMIRAFSELVKEFPLEKLRIYGEGSLEPKIKQEVRDLNLDNNILFMGRVNDIPTVLSRAKCFLLTSDYEGMPNGLLEAFTMGVPCIASNCPCGGPAEIIDDKVDGFLFPVGDSVSLVECMKTIIADDQNKSKCMAEHAMKKARCKFNPNTVIAEWEGFLLDMCKN